ncbi:ADP-ribosyl cyclase/cyclic ADP-ribose hydrolase-like isoform X3 [Clytia hemisphaerica]
MCRAHLVVYVLLLLASLYRSTHSAGTTPGLKEVFIGRCWQYQSISEHNKLPELKVNINCTKLWLAFYDSFAFKDPCTVGVDDYKTFFYMLHTSRKIKNALFWSGMHDLVTDFTFINDDYIVIGDTLTGYLLNNLNWCGGTDADGLNSTSCSKTCNVMTPAWTLASSEFAKRSTETAKVLLNATRANNKDAYADGSFFRTVEMPELQVDKLVVYLASSIGKEVRERCADSISMENIRADAEAKNIQVECIDQPSLVLNVYCLKYPKAKECVNKDNFRSDSNADKEEARLWKTVCLILVAVVAVLIVYITISLVHRAVCYKPGDYKYSHSWSFSKKPMLQDDEVENNNDIERVV